MPASHNEGYKVWPIAASPEYYSWLTASRVKTQPLTVQVVSQQPKKLNRLLGWKSPPPPQQNQMDSLYVVLDIAVSVVRATSECCKAKFPLPLGRGLYRALFQGLAGNQIFGWDVVFFLIYSGPTLFCFKSLHQLHLSVLPVFSLIHFVRVSLFFR